eukprot:snap_masked-scaffold_4-processed-gene-15.24-mRNA-1 protein AED:0.21 eAED:0.21 QI:0/-1/0/1/-1/1/1/0/417
MTKISLNKLLSVWDFKEAARAVLTKNSWDYLESAGDDEITVRECRIIFENMFIRPRILVNVSSIFIEKAYGANLSIREAKELLNLHKEGIAEPCRRRFSSPIYFTSTALHKQFHPEGEKEVVKAAYACNVPYMIATMASCSLDEILSAANPDQVLWMQMFYGKDKEMAFSQIRLYESKGISALFLNVDVTAVGNRERDYRNRVKGAGGELTSMFQHATDTFLQGGLTWDMIKEFVNYARIPVYLKGILSVEDAILAKKAGCRGVVLSNHGGRQIDNVETGISLLPKVISALNKQDFGILSTLNAAVSTKNQAKKFEVFVDGGVRRGSDVFKALANGATAVGVGRPVVYGLTVGGEKGIEHLIKNILEKELIMTMKLSGTPRIEDITKKYVVDRKKIRGILEPNEEYVHPGGVIKSKY